MADTPRRDAAEIAADAMALMLGGSSKRKSEEALVAGEVWLKVDDEDEWVLATVVSSDKSEVKLERLHAPEGVERSLTVSSKEYDVLKKVTGDFSRDAVNDDLVQLPDVNDASMLHTLRARFEQDDIYTAIGPVLVAINPYRPVPACSPETFAQLREAATATDRAALPPHVFKISLAAYVGMLNSGTSRGMAQSILISGESGAGKTETNKLCSADLQLEPPGLADELCRDAAHLLVPVSCVWHACLRLTTFGPHMCLDSVVPRRAERRRSSGRPDDRSGARERRAARGLRQRAHRLQQ